MTIETTKQVTSKVEVPVPSFWKRNCSPHFEYTAIIDEDTAIHIAHYETILVYHGHPQSLKGQITAAHEIYHLCTEQEFMEAYSKVLKSLSLQPELI